MKIGSDFSCWINYDFLIFYFNLFSDLSGLSNVESRWTNTKVHGTLGRYKKYARTLISHYFTSLSALWQRIEDKVERNVPLRRSAFRLESRSNLWMHLRKKATSYSPSYPFFKRLIARANSLQKSIFSKRQFSVRSFGWKRGNGYTFKWKWPWTYFLLLAFGSHKKAKFI